MWFWRWLCACVLVRNRTAGVSATVVERNSPLRIRDIGELRLEGEVKEGNLAKPLQHEQTLLEWAAQYGGWHADIDDSDDSRDEDASVFLTVGVKTSVVHGFANRQAIRQTWASAVAKPRQVRVVFLGCEPDLSAFSTVEKQQIQEAVTLEKRGFGDLLTSELRECRDSFATLAAKVKAYYYWVDQTHPSAAYAMVTDDDLYLRLDFLLGRLRDSTTPRTRFFGGNSASNAHRGLSLPVRDPRNKYFLSPAHYPMAELLPFLSGCHFIISRDLVQFIARNFEDLRDLGALDDTTIGLWLRALLRVEPTYYDDFQLLHSTRTCSDHDISFGDLTTEAIRFIHNNIVSGRPMCHDFALLSWAKRVRSIIVPSIDSNGNTAAASGEDDRSRTEWDVQHNETSSRLQIASRVIIQDKAVEFVYIPSMETFDAGFCRRANTQLQQRWSVTVGVDWCVYQRHFLLDSLNTTALQEPGLRGLVSLARHNMLRSIVEDANYLKAIPKPPPLVVVLSDVARSARVLIENLLVELNPESSVLVVHDDETPAQALVDVYVTAEGSFRPNDLRHRSKHVLVLKSEGLTGQEAVETHPRVLVLSAGGSFTVSTWRVPVSMASRLFSHTIRHSPVDLLRPGKTTAELSVNEKRIVAFISARGKLVSTPWQHLAEQLGDNTLGNSHNHCTQTSRHDTPRFCLDSSVEELKRVKFAIVYDASAMIIALLAGSIPVYVGPSTTTEVHRLFNPRAFIDCSLLESLDECACLVVTVDADVKRTEALLTEPGIVDCVAFVDHFFWHPSAADLDTNPMAREHRKRRLHRLQQWVKT